MYIRASKIYPNWDFGFENKPSGSPVLDVVMTHAGKKRGHCVGRVTRFSQQLFANKMSGIGNFFKLRE
jgi:hypothetical protein